MKKISKQHLENLTWLRALAAFFVVVSHSIRTAEVQYAPSDEPSHFLPLNFLDLGHFGVCLFFALSGCTLYLSNHNNIDRSGDIMSFYIKRFMRIWPTFALSLCAYLVFIEIFRLAYGGDKNFWIAQFLADYNLVNVFQYLSLTFNITGPRDLFVGPYWSLPIEFQYYLLLPFAIVLMSNKVHRFVVPLVFGAALYVLNSHSLVLIDRPELFKLGYTFFGGVLLANAYLLFNMRIPAVMTTGLLILVLSMVGLVNTGFLVIPSQVWFISDDWHLFGVSALICVALALFSRPLVIPDRLRSFLNDYGNVSYSIYLFHMLFVGAAAIAVTRIGIYGNMPKLTFILGFSLVLSFWFAKLTYQYIELPSMRLGLYWSETLRKNMCLAQAKISPSLSLIKGP